MTTLVVSNIGFEGRHGATAAERQTSRRFEVDLEIEADLELAAQSDRLAETLDFRVLSEIVVAVGTTGEPHHLLESLGRKMLLALSARFPGTRIKLDLRKLAPPYCAGNPAYASVRMKLP